MVPYRNWMLISILLMTYKEAYKTFVPKNSFNMYDRFFAGLRQYKKTIDGIVCYLQDKYNS